MDDCSDGAGDVHERCIASGHGCALAVLGPLARSRDLASDEDLDTTVRTGAHGASEFAPLDELNSAIHHHESFH